MEWISVEDRLPKRYQTVLVSTIIAGKQITVFSLMTYDVKFYIGFSDMPYSENVTHWMPLPEPPNN